MDDQGDKFNDVYWIKFKDIAAARYAKTKLNKSSFFSNELKVKYAPEFETVEDTREKIEERRSTILYKLQSNFGILICFQFKLMSIIQMRTSFILQRQRKR